MTPQTIEFRRGVIAPVKCLKEGLGLIKGQYWLFVGICGVGLLIGSAVPIVLTGPMMSGIFLCLLQHLHGEPVRFDRLFKGFDVFSPSLIATLIQMIPAMIIAVLVCVAMAVVMIFSALSCENGGHGGVGFLAGMVGGYVLILLLNLLLSVFFAFTFPLIVDRRLSGVEAVKTSVKAALANFGGVCGLVILNVLLSLAGMMLCYVGALLVIPITLAAQAIAYRRVFPEIPRSSPLPPPLPFNKGHVSTIDN